MRLLLVLTLSFAALSPAQTAISHGPILGRVGAHEIGVWARTNRPGSFRVRFGLSPERLDRLSAPTSTELDHDNAAWAPLEGLNADTRYYYQVLPAGSPDFPVAPDGSFRTLPDAQEYRNAELNPRGLYNLAFEYACGNNLSLGHPVMRRLPAFRTMLERVKDRVNFSILNGDWLYEQERDYPVEAWLKQVGVNQRAQAPRIVELAPSITGLWQNYKFYLENGPPLAEWHRNVPSFFTFDDHEILNDVYGLAEEGRRDQKAVLRDIAVRAWYDYLGWSNPVPWAQEAAFGRARLGAGSQVLTDPDADFTTLDLDLAANLHVHWGGQLAAMLRGDVGPGDPNAGVYSIEAVLDSQRLRISPPAKADGEAAYSVGRMSHYDIKLANAHLLFLDTRTFRELHGPDRRGASMLGKRQKEWVKATMAASDADFFFVVSSVNFMIPHVNPNDWDSGKDDAWTVFPEEREELIRFWDSLGKPVAVLTGDLHNSFAIRVTDRVWEFASGPHNSSNHRANDEAGRPPSGKFNSAGRECDIVWSTYYANDTPRDLARQPVYTVVQVNNVFDSPTEAGKRRWAAFPKPQVVVQFYNGYTGDLMYAQPLLAQ